VELHRLIAVPRLFANAALGRRIDAALETHPAFSTASRCEPVLAWFTQLVIDGVEAALADARPSPTRFLPAGDDWIIRRRERSVRVAGPVQGAGMARPLLPAGIDAYTDHACCSKSRRRRDRADGGVVATALTLAST
jgi:hypothetical protein